MILKTHRPQTKEGMRDLDEWLAKFFIEKLDDVGPCAVPNLRPSCGVSLLFVREWLSSGWGSLIPVAFPHPEFHLIPGHPALSRPCRSLFLLNLPLACPRIPFIDSRVPLICSRISLYLLPNRPLSTPESPFIDSRNCLSSVPGIALHRGWQPCRGRRLRPPRPRRTPRRS
jgi:hypothetical protein